MIAAGLRTLVVGAGLSMLSGASFAVEPWKPDANECNDKSDTLSIVDCLQGRTKFWDARLNQAWKAINAELAGNAPRLAALKTAQLSWIKYRDANCAYYYSDEGTIRQIETAQCYRDMTQSRAIELHGEASQ